MIRGVFGKRPAFGGGFGASMPQGMDIQDTANLGTPAPMRQRRPGLGTRLLGAGWEDKAAAIGSALSGNPFAIQQYQAQQAQMQQIAAARAEQQRQEAMRMAAAGRLGIGQDEAVLLGDSLGSVVADRFNRPEAPRPGSFEWFQTATPEQRAQYGQYRDAGEADEFVVVPIPGRGTYAGPRSGLPNIFGQGAPSSVGQSDWDSATPLGDAGSNARGGFRR